MARLIVYLKDCTMADVLKLMDEIRKNKHVDDVTHVTEEQAQRDVDVRLQNIGGGSFRFMDELPDRKKPSK